MGWYVLCIVWKGKRKNWGVIFVWQPWMKKYSDLDNINCFADVTLSLIYVFIVKSKARFSMDGWILVL